MIKNNLKVSLRVFSRNKAYTFINVLGLSTGLAIALLILVYVRFELSYEGKNPLADRIVRISVDLYNGKSLIDQDAEMYSPAGPRIASGFSEVESFTRVAPFNDATIRIGEESLRESKMFAVDSSFFHLFNYSLLYGNPKNIFQRPNEMVLTESQALKYFNRVNVVGESLWVSSFDEGFRIIGVVANNPLNTHIQFNVLISYPTIQDQAEKQSWGNNETYTYLLLKDQVTFNSFVKTLDSFNDQLHKEGKMLSEKILAQPIKDIHLYSHKSYEMGQNGDATSVYFLLGVALLVIVIAIVNYINLSTSKSLDRAKEVGVRKVIGSSLAQLRAQFFTESLLINIFSATLALGLVVVSFPAFKAMAGLPLGLHFWNDALFWRLLLFLVLISTVLSGIFPAFVLSSFQPIQVLKGKFAHSGRGLLLRKGLVVFQFSITLFLIIQTFTTRQQLTFMRNIDMGLNIERTLVVPTPDDQALRASLQVLKDKLLDYAQFQSVSFSSSVPGQSTSELSSSNANINLVGALEEKAFNFYIYFMDEDFIPTMEMQLKAGENFTKQNLISENILVNEESIKLWGIPDAEMAIGQQIDLWGKKRTIIGVVKNFHQGSAKNPYLPMLFVPGLRDWAQRFVSIRLQSGGLKENLDLIKGVYASVFPNSPFDYFFMDQEFDKQYRYEEQFQAIFGTLTGFAILISCLGLFGLVSFTVANRTKEIGLRKVLGAGTGQIVALISKDFISLIFIALFISTTITYFIIQRWLEQYSFRIDLNIWLFAIPAAGILVISLLTILTKTIQVSSANPVKALKDE
ncbi:MAG: ABC transporter permease [Cyclobacteriaceae bacterium]|nr:ABC transporter permease [Cyclobacteriaceae bacterium]MCB0498717.1 ABC transporter permease [Cyclobacteriaceae bacterium]MCB9237771.1 ABC transporter permease [Flammeovirgaceae bacterium]MCO5270128.1 ABC transporter permease [Cyclobacteriaceae bacterium]MCW5903132.1 ABC transporter permease [Cyclobacteriaceae bacterium]